MPPARWLLLATAALLPPPTSSFHGAVPSAVHRRRRAAASTTTTALSARPKRGKAESDVAFIKNTELSNDTPETDDEFLSAFFGDAELGFGVTAEDVADAIEDRAAGLVEDREDDLPEAPKAAAPKAARKALPHIAVVGAPNVGKSTLVNRLADGGQTDLSAAITADEPGVTRDRTYREGQWNGYRYQVVDTGGLVFDDKEGETYVDDIKSQAAIALDEAAAAVFVVDGKMGATGFDENVAAWLRRDVCKTTPVMVAVNKCESEMTGDAQAAEFYRLGLGEPMPVSAIHGTGVAELLDMVVDKLWLADDADGGGFDFGRGDAENREVSVAIVGKPNVGKSTLLNRLLGYDRAITSEVAGTTRDAIDATMTVGDTTYKLLDTAGLRRKAKVKYGPEFFMVNRALKAIRRADVVVLVIDAAEGLSDQERVLAHRITEDGRACVVVANKWDIVSEKDDRTYLRATEEIRSMLPTLPWADILFASALTGQRCNKLLDLVAKAYDAHDQRISTSVLNEVLRDAVAWQPPPCARGKTPPKIMYCTQVSTKPPTIAVFTNDPNLISDNYKRYLERKFREAIPDFAGTSIKWLWRAKSNRAQARGQAEAPMLPKRRTPRPYA